MTSLWMAKLSLDYKIIDVLKQWISFAKKYQKNNEIVFINKEIEAVESKYGIK